MSKKSPSTIDRDHRRAVSYESDQRLRELVNFDWKSVEYYELLDLYDEIHDLRLFCESDQQLEFISQIEDLIEEQLA